MLLVIPSKPPRRFRLPGADHTTLPLRAARVLHIFCVLFCFFQPTGFHCTVSFRSNEQRKEGREMGTAIGVLLVAVYGLNSAPLGYGDFDRGYNDFGGEHAALALDMGMPVERMPMGKGQVARMLVALEGAVRGPGATRRLKPAQPATR
jgi:hypothetical protein